MKNGLKNFITGWDIALAAVLLAVGIGASFLSLGKGTGTTVSIEVNGELYGTYSLLENQEIVISQIDDRTGEQCENVVCIEDGMVFMEKSTCHNQVCVDMGKINSSAKTIVCLPNKVTVSISDEEGGADVISG